MALAIGLAGCGAANPGGGNTDENRPAGLARFGSSTELVSYFAEQNSAAINSRGDVLATDEDAGNGGSGADAPTAMPSPDGAAGVADLAANGHSNTTQQEEGVQESDIVKNDGTHLYLLSRGVLRVVAAQPAESLSEAGSLELGGWGQELFLVGDRAVTLTTPDPSYGGEEPAFDTFMPVWRPQTDVTIISLADKSALHESARVRLDGYVNSSRVIDGRLYLVVVNYPDYWMGQLGGILFRTTDGSEVNSDDLLPDVAIEKEGEAVFAGNISDATDIYRPANPDGLGFTSLITIPLDAPENYTAETLVGYPANIYASTEAIYVTNSEWNFRGEQRETTDVYKFALTSEGTQLVAAGTIPGRVLNQYSMSESNGMLRIATTLGPKWDENGEQTTESSNNVFVLEQTGEELAITGRVENIAPGESIYAARFIGDKGFLVTFEQIDPLFTVDLSNPRDPKIVGQLEVPGFSTFIVPLDATHLLTIGQNTTTSPWGGVVAEGVRLSIFDVSDFANPQLVTAEVVGTNGGYSEAIYNPKAFTFYAEAGLLAFPMEIYNWAWAEPVPVPGMDDGGAADASEGTDAKDGEGDGNSSSGSTPEPDIYIPAPLPPDYFRGVYVYDVSVAGGFKQLGRVSATPAGLEDARYYPDFMRGQFIGTTSFTVTSDMVKAVSVTEMDKVVSEIDFPIPDWFSGGGVVDGGVAEPRPVDE
jgi:hypothetical protein